MIQKKVFIELDLNDSNFEKTVRENVEVFVHNTICNLSKEAVDSEVKANVEAAVKYCLQSDFIENGVADIFRAEAKKLLNDNAIRNVIEELLMEKLEKKADAFVNKADLFVEKEVTKQLKRKIKKIVSERVDKLVFDDIVEEEDSERS